MYSFPNLEAVCCSTYGSNCCFLICIRISQEAGKVVLYSHLLKNFPQFVMIHSIINLITNFVQMSQNFMLVSIICFYILLKIPHYGWLH